MGPSASVVLSLWLAVACFAMPAQAPPAQAPAVAESQPGASVPGEFKGFPAARAKTDEILSRHEFRRVQPNSYADEKFAKVMLLISTLFAGAFGILPKSPWLATALEWGVLAAAAIALLIWAWRVSKQQRVGPVAARGPAGEAWQRESDNWAERARTEAGRGEWREAVHCLYWSAIVLLEGQRMWRQNRARTPREYVNLLEPGSDKRQALGGLTRVFERIWYGLRPAAEQDYEQAAAMLDQLRAR